tara:strand:+ start:47 stop:364 length:318 start_codon:yes stop_codon:yes gene_type:complete
MNKISPNFKIKKILFILGVWFSSFVAFTLIFYSTSRSAEYYGESAQSILGAVIAIFVLRLFLIALANKDCKYRYFGIAVPIQKNQYIPIMVSFFWSYLSILMQKL